MYINSLSSILSLYTAFAFVRKPSVRFSLFHIEPRALHEFLSPPPASAQLIFLHPPSLLIYIFLFHLFCAGIYTRVSLLFAVHLLLPFSLSLCVPDWLFAQPRVFFMRLQQCVHVYKTAAPYFPEDLRALLLLRTCAFLLLLWEFYLAMRLVYCRGI